MPSPPVYNDGITIFRTLLLFLRLFKAFLALRVFVCVAKNNSLIHRKFRFLLDTFWYKLLFLQKDYLPKE